MVYCDSKRLTAGAKETSCGLFKFSWRFIVVSDCHLSSRLLSSGMSLHILIWSTYALIIVLICINTLFQFLPFRPYSFPWCLEFQSAEPRARRGSQSDPSSWRHRRTSLWRDGVPAIRARPPTRDNRNRWTRKRAWPITRGWRFQRPRLRTRRIRGPLSGQCCP